MNKEVLFPSMNEIHTLNNQKSQLLNCTNQKHPAMNSEDLVRYEDKIEIPTKKKKKQKQKEEEEDLGCVC